MRNRLLIVVLGLTLGLGARFGLVYYHQWQRPSPAKPQIPETTAAPTKGVKIHSGQ